MSIESLFGRYELSARAQGLSPKTIQYVTSPVRFFAQFIGGIDDVRKVTADDLKRFIVHLRGRTRWQDDPQVTGGKLSATSINTYTRGIKSFWAFLKREGIISNDPLSKVQAPKLPKKLPKVLSSEEVRAVFNAVADDKRGGNFFMW